MLFSEHRMQTENGDGFVTFYTIRRYYDMYTKEDLKQHLAALGVKPTDTVFVHTSMKAIGEVEGGAEAVIDALKEYLQDEGLLVFPTHTWRQMKGDYNTFDPKTEPSCVGLLSNLAWKRPDAVRSLHPDHSACAFGKDAEAYCAGDAVATTPCPRNGTMGGLIDRKGIILMIGCSTTKNTFLHSVEELAGVPDRLATTPTDFYVIHPDGSRRHHPIYRHLCSRGYPSENYDCVVPELLASGAMWTGRFGDAKVYAERADLVFEQVCERLKENPDYLIEYRPDTDDTGR